MADWYGTELWDSSGGGREDDVEVYSEHEYLIRHTTSEWFCNTHAFVYYIAH